MIRTIMETNTLLYLIAAAGALGIFFRLLVSRRYAHLTREASDVQVEKKDFIRQLRYRYRMNQKRSGDRVDIPVFVRRYLYEYRFRRLSLHQWKRLAAGHFLAAMGMALLGVYTYMQQGAPAASLQNLLWTAGGVTLMTAAAGLWTDLSYKEERLKTVLEDYLCCMGAGNGQLEELTEAAPAKETRRIPAIIGIRKKGAPAETRAQRDKRELKTNLAKIREAGRETAAASEQDRERNREILRGMDSREQERIIRDVLAEFLA